jgi:hypothetical protein
MAHPEDETRRQRRLMHRRTVECEGYLRDDGLWEVEARLVDVKPFPMRDRYRGSLQAGEPVHEICLRLAVDDDFKIHEAETSMRATPFPTCMQVEPVLRRLIGERIGKGWRELVRQRIGKLEGCTHLSELLGPAVTALFQTISYGRTPEGRDSLANQRGSTELPFFINGCHSWRTDGPIVAEIFPQFSTRAAAKK